MVQRGGAGGETGRGVCILERSLKRAEEDNRSPTALAELVSLGTKSL